MRHQIFRNFVNAKLSIKFLQKQAVWSIHNGFVKNYIDCLLKKIFRLTVKAKFPRIFLMKSSIVEVTQNL